MVKLQQIKPDSFPEERVIRINICFGVYLVFLNRFYLKYFLTPGCLLHFFEYFFIYYYYYYWHYYFFYLCLLSCLFIITAFAGTITKEQLQNNTLQCVAVLLMSWDEHVYVSSVTIFVIVNVLSYLVTLNSFVVSLTNYSRVKSNFR